jgi:hypothetical protein
MRDEAFQLELKWERHADGHIDGPRLEFPSVPLVELKACIVDSRVFFLTSEDCYLPSVVSALRAQSTREHAQALEPLKEYVNQFIRDGRLHGALVYSGRIESDNGVGPGRLLGSDQVAMDYINGVALHEDEERLARLENVESSTLEHTVLMQLALLLKAVRTVRTQLIVSIAGGHVHATIPNAPGAESLDKDVLDSLPSLRAKLDGEANEAETDS